MDDSPTPELRRLLVIDGANAIYRAFFGVPPLRSPSGTPTNAVYGFVNMLLKVLREERPDYVAVAFDPPGGSFRSRLFEDYKAGRDKQPEDLSTQIPLMKELVDAFHIPLLEVPDFEADDVIATLAAMGDDTLEILIISTDKDLMQLVSKRVTLLDGMKDRRYAPADVEARFGVPPEKMLDWRALVGDSSDNIPGVKGIGEKGAAKLIEEWGSLENLLEHRSEVKAKRARTALEEHEEEARLSKQLSELRNDVDVGHELEGLAATPPDRERLRELYKRLGFGRLVEGLDAEAGEGPGARERVAEKSPTSPVKVEVVANDAAWGVAAAMLAELAQVEVLAVAEPGSALESQLVGLAFALDGNRALYVPRSAVATGQTELPGVGNADGGGDAGVSDEALLSGLRDAMLDSPDRVWLGEDTKDLQSMLAELGFELSCPHFDLQVAAFLVDPSGAHHIASLAIQHLGREVASWEELAGRGAKAVPARQLPREEVAHWAAAQVCALHDLVPAVRGELDKAELSSLFADVEMPLTAVLSRMERSGVRVDEAHLLQLSQEYEKELARLEGEIYELAGEKFLVSSPKQLQVILFDKLMLPPIKKTKTGFSTDEGVLEQLTQHHELPGRILAWRRLAKLKSTYVDALPKLVCARSGRIHPHFNQLGAATGRMSASDPNVQNIPIRTAEGVRIREAFVPAEGCRLLSADYSQVELRILAHYSGDESLLDAFAKGEDVHRRTAAEVAGITPEEVSDDQRARAKAVNFGIIYGSSSFGLANQLVIAAAEALETIDTYFERYAGVARFLSETVAEAKERGFVTTLLGRRRYLPDLNSRNRTLRQAAERMAVNTVIQGTAADLIKKAMVQVDSAITEAALGARMLLQVHDELVFDVPEAELEQLEGLARSAMEGVFELRVPLVVDVGCGKNWREAH